MSHVMDAAPEPPTPAFSNVRRSSRLFAWLFTGLLCVIGAAALVVALAMAFGASWVILDTKAHQVQVSFGLHGNFAGLGLVAETAGKTTFNAVPMAERVALALSAMVGTAPILMIFWNLRALFGLYARGVVFAQENSRRIKSVGAWLVAAAVAPALCHVGLSLIMSDPGSRWFHADALSELVLGGLVFVIAQVMQVGREIEEDRGGAFV